MKLQKNNVISNYLHSVGVKGAELKLYLSGLDKGGVCRVSQLIDEIGITASTVYAALDRLQGKGLVITNQEGRELVAEFTPLQKIGSSLRKESLLLEQKISQLPEILKQSGLKDQSCITEANSIEEITALLISALQCRSKKWDIIAPKRNFLKDLDKEFITFFKTTRRSQGIESRTLWEKPLKDAFSVSFFDIKTRKPRLLPEKYSGTLCSMMILYDEKVLLIDEPYQHHAVLIDSNSYHSLMSVMFETVWLAAMKP